MRIRVYKSYGYAGTDSVEEEEVPDEIATDPEKLKEWIDEQYECHGDEMCQRLSLSIDVCE